jgi:hypothetical protein
MYRLPHAGAFRDPPKTLDEERKVSRGRPPGKEVEGKMQKQFSATAEYAEKIEKIKIKIEIPMNACVSRVAFDANFFFAHVARYKISTDLLDRLFLLRVLRGSA